MKAFTRYRYGGSETLKIEEVALPGLLDNQVLVKVLANSANPADWHILRGDPFFSRFTYGLFRPKNKLIGSDFSGIVIRVGKLVTRFKAGDKVLGSTLKGGAYAEYISVPENACGHMHEHTSYTDAASLPIAGLTAFQALIKHGALQPGETVLINGATGGVGHFAVQIAKAYQAKVTAVCSSNSIDFAKSLGADEVIAYNKENIHQHNGKYDLVIDFHGNLAYQDYLRMGKRGVMVGFTNMKHMIALLFKSATGKLPIRQFTVDINTADLDILVSMVQQNKVTPRIEKTYSFKQIPEAVTYIEGMHAKGKVVMIWEE